MNLPKPKSHTNYLKTHSNLHSIDNEFTLGPLNPPSINDKEILTSFYKISDDNDIISNKSPIKALKKNF